MDSTEQDGGWFCVTKDACFRAAIRTYSTRPSGVQAKFFMLENQSKPIVPEKNERLRQF